MTIKTVSTATMPYNPFDYLETQEEINEYLTDAFQDDDPRLFIIALGYLARKKGMTKIAEKAGMQIVNQFKRPVLNRTERDKNPYSEIIFHLKNNL